MNAPLSARRRYGEPRELARAIVGRDRAALARAITCVESTRDEDAELAQELLTELMPHVGGALRIGITGTPGAGKSTCIERLGLDLIRDGKRVAVLAVDPSSTVSGGSILGDKTRMSELSRCDQAFIRPSPSGGTLGGVGRRSRETLLLCEAAGYDVVLVETVGVGQSETLVFDMVDCFVALIVPGSGDQLQGIKRGILEVADFVVVNKADGDRVRLAHQTANDYARALELVAQPRPCWRARALSISAETGTGMAELWAAILEQREALESTGELDALRKRQQLAWLDALIDEGLRHLFESDPSVRSFRQDAKDAVAEGRTTPVLAARDLLARFRATRDVSGAT